MTTDIKVSAELMGYTLDEQMTILKHVDRESQAPSQRMQETVDKIIKIIDESPIQDTFEGYGGFPIEKTVIDKNKRQSPDDRNIGRVISPGGQSMVITGRKSDGRYIVVGKKGEKTAKYAEDIGVQGPKESIDIDDLHRSMLEAMTVTNADKKGNTPAWQNYKKGMKNKKGESVYKKADHVKEDTITEISADLALKASKKADVERGKAAAAGNKEKAKAKAGQASRLYTAQKKKRLGEETIDDLIERYIDLDDAYIDEISFEELETLFVEALEELDEGLLNEALEAIDGIELLTEAPSKHSAFPNVAVQAPKKDKPRDAGAIARKTLQDKQGSKDNSGPSRAEKMKSALKSAGSAVKKGLKKVPYQAGKAAGTAVNVASKVASGAKKAGSDFKSGYKDARASAKKKSSSSTTSSSSTDGKSSVTGNSYVSGSGRTAGSSSSSSGSSPAKSGGGLKAGIKKVVGKIARSVSRGSRNVARRMGESYDWRKAMEENK